MSDPSEAPSPETEGTQSPPSATEPGKPEGAAAASDRLQDVLEALKKHPLGTVAAGAALGLLIEEEIAIGLLAGVGLSALLATRSGPEARRELITKAQEILERTRTRFKAHANEPGEAPTAEAPKEPEAPSAGAN